jgi:tetraacyldisaccharide 4'-kinase
MQLIRLVLLPFSWIYGLVVWIRNVLYDLNLLKSSSVEIPCLVIGNLSFGGTGKSPMTMWIIEQMSGSKKVAVLSRGYGRSSQGFREVGLTDDYTKVGDEPLMIKRRFPAAGVFVSEDRVKGLKEIEGLGYEFVVLDDAFQHRRLSPTSSFLLTEYGRPFFKDHYFPAGRLRDSLFSRRRAAAVIVTKCPAKLTSVEIESFLKELKPSKDQSVAFSSVTYKDPISLFQSETLPPGEVVLITGIENPTPFFDYCSLNYKVLKHFKFKDHHTFSQGDIETILKVIGTFENSKVGILTTEKDMVRLLSFETLLSRIPIHYVPIDANFIDGEQEIKSLINQQFESV